MSLADRLGPLALAPTGCAVCRWYGGLDEADRRTFDAWVDGGGNVSQLWRQCASDPDRPLTVQRPRFAECLRDHNRKAAYVPS
ncbi:hypothetical protein SEA_MARSHAWN_36 [Mycobacterium phage Marshawn]|uniref:Uncharacterized protein n=1 Tax=Mycobacterium phage Marshawn TaxID=2652423 RepID=A0A5P8D8Q8_9CAUD|nr:hypothetical protein I5H02_gp63 [Mycobacterium phage Marshawn]QFP94822.1 hypothetical protein SEA_MARSHAWN_36 [Mycobacterium phage Marshawn]